MPLWESIVVLGIWLMVKRWLRWRRSDPDALSSPLYRPSSERTGQRRNLLADADPERIAHNGVCRDCGCDIPVSMTRTRLERRPWRLVWRCQVCGSQQKVTCPPEVIETFIEWDRAGGTSLSMREVAEMVQTDLAEFERAVQDEILP